MPIVHKRFNWFPRSQVGDVIVYPFEQMFFGRLCVTTRENITATRSYYQRRFPGRVWAIKKVPEGYMVTRMPDGTTLKRGGRQTVPDGPASGAARQHAYRQREAALFAYAVSTRGATDPNPKVKAIRDRARFQIENTAATIKDAWDSFGSPDDWSYTLKARQINDISPETHSSAWIVSKRLAKLTGREWRVELEERITAGKPALFATLVTGMPRPE